jgi:hypothetical protein
MAMSSFEERIAALHTELEDAKSKLAAGGGLSQNSNDGMVFTPAKKALQRAITDAQQSPPQATPQRGGGGGGRLISLQANGATGEGGAPRHDLQARLTEEQRLYRDLEAEHEDLLALLAQQELEKNAIRDKLLEVAGQEAYDAARKVAERQCLSRFGLFVPVSSAVFSFAIIYLK